MSSNVYRTGQLAFRWLMDPMSQPMPSMDDIAPQFPQTTARESSTPRRFQTPGWVRTVADFFSPDQQAVTAGAPFIMQMSGSKGSSIRKPRGSYSSHPKEWKRYYKCLSDAELHGLMHAQRDKWIAFIGREAEQLNRTFADVFPPEVMSLDPLDIDYWERVNQCLFKPVGLDIVDRADLDENQRQTITKFAGPNHELAMLLYAILERTNLVEELDLIELLVMERAADLLTDLYGSYRVTHEELVQAHDRQSDACAVRRADSDSFLDPLPDEGREYCPDPLGDD